MSREPTTKTKKELIKFKKWQYDTLCLLYGKKYNKPEEWKRVVIDDYETDIKVSNYGRVHYIANDKPCRVFVFRNHFSVSIKVKDKMTIKGTYRLVALMFIPIPQEYIDAGYTLDKLVVDHKRDGDKDNPLDNTVWNLQWLTYRENTSKAAKCGYRTYYDINFRGDLDKMILDGCDNDEIYKMCKEKYDYDKEEVKAQVQVRRRRLGVTLKDHYEHDPKFVKKVDNLILKGLQNNEIIKKLNMPTDTRESTRLLQYRRTILKVPAKISKYFTNEQSKLVNEYIAQGLKNNDILQKLNMINIPHEDEVKVRATLRARRTQYNRKLKDASSTTRES